MSFLKSWKLYVLIGSIVIAGLAVWRAEAFFTGLLDDWAEARVEAARQDMRADAEAVTRAAIEDRARQNAAAQITARKRVEHTVTIDRETRKAADRAAQAIKEADLATIIRSDPAGASVRLTALVNGFGGMLACASHARPAGPCSGGAARQAPDGAARP